MMILTHKLYVIHNVGIINSLLLLSTQAASCFKLFCLQFVPVYESFLHSQNNCTLYIMTIQIHLLI